MIIIIIIILFRKTCKTRKTGKTATWNWAKSWVKNFRTTVAREAGARRHENGGFGTDFFRRIRERGRGGAKSPKKCKNLEMTKWLEREKLEVGIGRKVG